MTLIETAAAAASSDFSEISSSIAEVFTNPAEATTALETHTTAPGTSTQPTEETKPATTEETTAVEETRTETSTVEWTSTAETDDATPIPLPSSSVPIFQAVGVALGAESLVIWSMARLAAVTGVGMAWL